MRDQYTHSSHPEEVESYRNICQKTFERTEEIKSKPNMGMSLRAIKAANRATSEYLVQFAHFEIKAVGPKPSMQS